VTFDEAFARMPSAHSVRTFLCANPKCQRVHVLLLDRDEMPIAHFVVPDGFVKTLQNALYEAATVRGEK
jgi:hypothetical protein